MISRINSYSPAFGVVRKSAINQAIKDANGNRDKLRAVDKWVRSQELNMDFDIEYVRLTKPLGFNDEGYGVINNESGVLVNYYDTLEDACFVAQGKPQGRIEADIDDYDILD